MSKEIGIEDDLRPEYDLKQLLQGGVKGKYAERFDHDDPDMLDDYDFSQGVRGKYVQRFAKGSSSRFVARDGQDIP